MNKAKGVFEVVSKLIMVFALVYLFLLSIGLMSAAFKGFGKEFAETLISSTSNPFIALFIGVFATSIVQSSSTTTSIVVGMVGSGVLTVGNAVPIIMGANIGTAVTNTLVSLGHVSRREEFKRAIAGATVHDFFNLLCVAVMFPIEIATGFLQKMAEFLSRIVPTDISGASFHSPVSAATKPVIKWFSHFLTDGLSISKETAYVVMLAVSFVIIFFALAFIVKIMKTLVMNRAEIVFDNILTKNMGLALLGGFVFTVIVQSSSITTSLLVPLVASGVLTIETAFPITMGANIGTTVTAILASLATGNINAIVIAFVHFLFNCVGVSVFFPIPFFRKIPLYLANSLGELAFIKRRYAVLYVLGVYFFIPGILIALSKFMG